MEDRRSIIISAIIGIIVLLLIVGTIIYLIRFIFNRPQSTSVGTPTPRTVFNSPVPEGSAPIVVRTPVPSATSLPGRSVPGGTKTFKGTGFEINYPQSWGILTCANSSNIEFDPTRSTDQLRVVCDFAVKPVTVIVGSTSCVAGENVNKGGVIFTKEVKQVSTGVNYKWCTQTNPPLEITHRVSSAGGRATSTQDFSNEIEDMISKISFNSAVLRRTL